MKIALVTEELSGWLGSGGIGAAFHELSLLLSDTGYEVDVLYCPTVELSKGDTDAIINYYFSRGIRLDVLNSEDYVNGKNPEHKAYAVYKHLVEVGRVYDVIHFHDYKGLGFFCFSAKKQGISFSQTTLVLQMHGPTRWALAANKAFFTHEDQLKIDFMERECTRKADVVVSPSQYLVDWLTEYGYITQADRGRLRVIKNACGELFKNHSNEYEIKGSKKANVKIDELIFFGRHERRKGIKEFCDALDLIDDELSAGEINVTILGKFGEIDGIHSGLYLVQRAKNWSFKITLRTDLDRNGVARYMRGAKTALVLVCSKYENSPYTVLETALLGKPLVCSNEGGASELIGGSKKGWHLVSIDKHSLADKILQAIELGAPVPVLSETPDQIAEQWLNFHKKISVQVSNSVNASSQPRVVLGITHYERPDKLIDAIMSAIRQSYKNVEIVVVDDGSERRETLAALEEIEELLARVGGRLLRQKNAYLGAARNAIIRNTDADYLIFLDDDDIAFPGLVENLVKAIQNSSADAVTCLNIYMPEDIRTIGVTRPECFVGKPSYIPLGGPLSVALMQNNLGAATSIFRRSTLLEVGAYTELYGVGHEDYELYLKFIQLGKSIEVCPIPLYLYETGRVGMLVSTSISDNYQRNFGSLDFSMNPQAWSDFINLSLGKKVAVDSINRPDWIYSSVAKSELALKVHRRHYANEKELLGLLRLLSEELGAQSIVDSFSHENKDEKVSLKNVKSVFHSRIRKVGLDGRQAQAIPGIKIGLALNRIDSAFKEMIAYLVARESFDGSCLSTLSFMLPYLSQVKDKNINKKLGEVLEVMNIDQVYVDNLRFIILAINYYSGDLEGVRSSIVDVILEDENDYLSKYSDVAESVASGHFKSGLMHYVNHGIMEGWRNGFCKSENLMKDFCRLINKSFSFNLLVEFFHGYSTIGNSSL